MKNLVLIGGLFSLGTALLAQANRSVAGFRLGYVRSVYIESLGTDDASKIVRDQLAGALLNRTRLRVENDRSSADARLIGTAMVTSGYRHSMEGSASSAAAAATSRGGTIRITEVGLQLTDPDGSVLWAFDGTRCLNTKPVTVCAVEQLAKAIDKNAKQDAKEARSHR